MYINKSLSYLEQVVVALTTKDRSHIPYRQTKLTNILKDSLGGNCRTLMIACVWVEPAHLEETISTLQLAQRMMKVRNATYLTERPDPTLLLKKYERVIKELRQVRV
jgi:kinesin family protein 6/9